MLDGTAGDAAGMSVLARLPDGRAATLGDVEVAGALRAGHVGAVAVSPFFARPRPQQGLLLGFAATPEERIAPAVARMAQVLRNA